MTFSIVARDPATGQLGVAVATCALAVGRAAPWARAGVGAVATQALSQRGYGPRLLDRLAAGDAAGRRARPAAGRRTRTPTSGRSRVVGTAGAPAAWTGVGCLSACGHRTGDGHRPRRATCSPPARSSRRSPRGTPRRPERDRRPRRPAGGRAAGRRRGRRRPARPAVGRADRGLRHPGRRGALGGRAGGPAGRRRRRPGRRAGAAAAVAARVRDRGLRAARAGRRRRGYGSCTGRWPRPPAATGTAPGTRCARCGSAPAGRAGCAGCGSTAGCPPPRSSCAADRRGYSLGARRAAWRCGCRAG